MTPGSRRFLIRHGDSEVNAELVGADRVRVGPVTEEVGVEPCGDGEYLVRDGDRTWHVVVAGPPERRFVHVDGLTWLLEAAPADRAPARRRQHDTAAVAPMPATVLEILVKPGQTVDAGDVLLTLEAMKMEMPVRAPRAGTVTGIRCTEGELVQPGVVLVEIV